MAHLPARHEPSQFGLFLQPEDPGPPPNDSRSLVQLFRIVLRGWWIVALTALLLATAAAAMVFRMPRVYRAAATLRIDDKGQNLADVFREVSTGPELITEMEVLKSRSLAEDAVTTLGLQARVTQPRGLARADVLTNLTVQRNAAPSSYVITRTNYGRYSVQDTSGNQISTVSIGERVKFRGLGFALAPSAAQYSKFRLDVSPFDRTVEDFTSNLSVSQSNREARIVVVQYDDTDRELVWQVPNLIVSRFMARRLDSRRSEAATSVIFLRSQLDTLSAQLARAEGALRDYRQSQQVVNPAVESSTQVTRMVSLESQRGELEAERSALSHLLASIDSEAAVTPPGEPSPYRRMIAFPTLLRNSAAASLLNSLANVEDQRSQLLTKRTVADPDVQVLSSRISQMEVELRAIGTTYLQGLTDQVVSVDSVLKGFGDKLARVPQRELNYARLERQPKVLEDMYSLLQTRLKEAEIAAAASDPSIRIVDPAVEPIRPIKPRRMLLTLGALLCGIILATGGIILREYLDKAVHTRADVHGATGLQVLGLIPTITQNGNITGLIARKASNGRHARPALTSPPAPGAPPPAGTSRTWSEFTFLTSPECNLPPDRPQPEPQARPVARPEAIRHVTIAGIGSAVAEAYGSLQTNISYTRSEEPIKSLLFTSSMPGEGKTTSAANLALTLAQRGLRVLLIDGDLRRGAVHLLFESGRTPGLTDLLRGTRSLAEVIRVVQPEEGQAMHYVATGQLPSYPTQLLESGTLKVLLQSVREDYDMVILDSPPVNLITDAAILATHVDGVLLVARAGQTASPSLEYAMSQLRHVRGRVLGVVLNDIDFKREAIYDAAYRYYSSEEYTRNPAT